jgi:hypothetical protein
MVANYPTPTECSQPPGCHVQSEETFWRRALEAPGESTAFDRRVAAQAREDWDWTGPRRVAL